MNDYLKILSNHRDALLKLRSTRSSADLIEAYHRNATTIVNELISDNHKLRGQNDRLLEEVTRLQEQLQDETDKDDYFAFTQVTSASESEMRTAHYYKTHEHLSPSESAKIVLEFTPSYAKELLRTRTEPTPSNDIGCFNHTLAAHSKSTFYAKVNLKSQLGEVNKNVYLHHLAVLAKTNEDGKAMLQGVYASSSLDGNQALEVSHLCHNTKCVNPDHLTVETKAANLGRSSCKNQKRVHFGQKGYDPCDHRKAPTYKSCILPVVHICSSVRTSK